MGNGNICVNTKDYLNERNFTLQYPSHSKEEQKLFQNNLTIDCYNNTNGNKNIIYPNYYNNSNFITINSRKWFKAAPKKIIMPTPLCKHEFQYQRTIIMLRSISA